MDMNPIQPEKTNPPATAAPLGSEMHKKKASFLLLYACIAFLAVVIVVIGGLIAFRNMKKQIIPSNIPLKPTLIPSIQIQYPTVSPTSLPIATESSEDEISPSEAPPITPSS
jgi:hypothetical protein